LCALIHKFDASDLKGPPPRVMGQFYVFVDECHRRVALAISGAAPAVRLETSPRS